MYYQFKKTPKIGKFTTKFGWSIHETINKQCDFKPNITHNNDLAYLYLIYSNYKKGYTTKQEFLDKLSKRKFIKKYYNRFIP